MKYLNVFVFIILCSSLNGQDTEGIIKVNKVQGVEAYFLAEPLQDYEVVLDSRNGLQWGSLLTDGLINESINAKANQLVRKVLKVAKKQNVEIDAVVYYGGKRIAGVKFKEDIDESQKGKGKVIKINGVEVYLLGEPEKDYKIVMNVRGGLKMKSLVTSGLANNSIDEDIEKMIRKLNKKTKSKGGADAIVYQTGKSAIGVKFE